MYEYQSEKRMSSNGQNGEKIEMVEFKKVNGLYYFDGCYHFLLTKQKNCLLLHFSKTFWLFNRNCFIGSFYYICKREGLAGWKWKSIFIWLTKLNFEPLTDSRVGYKVIKIRLLILHFICIQIVFKIKVLCSKMIE